MSSTKDPVLGATHDDESARVDIAVKALGDMRSRAAAPATEGRLLLCSPEFTDHGLNI